MWTDTGITPFGTPTPTCGGQAMDRERCLTFRDYIRLQLLEIQKHKWIESEKVGRDLGQEAVFDWIERYAEAFRRYYEPMLRDD